MNTLKRTLALVATLAMSATAFASCGDKGSSSTSEKATEAATSANDEATTGDAETTTAASETKGQMDPSIKQGGKEFTVVAWNADDVPYLIAQWKGLSYDTIVQDLADGKVEGVNANILNVKGGEAADNYDQLFNGGEDMDVYLV
ncbi:MAG: carbohydrate ABC transporter substrate-binding protein, partial [Ruminococcus sp.]|nr:carbohydrate ABC transporter substrate-binding protein [Ruminococcus sp.]